MSAGRSCRALGAKDSTAVQSRPRKQTSERTRDRAELAKLGNCGNRGTVKIHGVSDGGEPCDLEPSGATKDHGFEPAQAHPQHQRQHVCCMSCLVSEQGEGVVGLLRCFSPAKGPWSPLCELTTAGYLLLLGFLYSSPKLEWTVSP